MLNISGAFSEQDQILFYVFSDYDEILLAYSPKTLRIRRDKLALPTMTGEFKETIFFFSKKSKKGSKY
jgi:hypothetical protein